MKWIALTLVTLTIILVILYFAIGGEILAIGLGIIGLIAIITSVFSLGIWYAHKSIQLGAKLVIEAQNNNDRWDSVKMESLAQFGGEVLKLRGQNNANYPLLETGNNDDTVDVSFTIRGIDDNE